MVVACWLVVGGWLGKVVGANGHSPVQKNYHYSLFTIYYLLFIIYYLLFIIYYLLFTIHYSLFTSPLHLCSMAAPPAPPLDGGSPAPLLPFDR
ncbi:hypothetical protein H6G72_04135 [Planktothricoides sp. FACHB-1370]|uniref:Uncharacterized protein n=1 Tax=Planktothricoides raciborskii FACHB-1370 TaxID=2949576 RepID=A0ABR8E8L1_9CYAN|nr:hypothetical protein [Planktothricoides raciborskii FACHB-1370]MBD2581932.1 hypothetical protein [Planktothricoides raciborskii FACHB-1261]